MGSRYHQNISSESESVLFLFQEKFLVDERGSFILEKHVFQLVENIHCYLLSISLSQLSVLLHMSAFHVFPLVLFAVGVELIPQKLQIGLLLFLQLHTDSHLRLIVAGVAERFQFLVDERRVSDVVHGDRITAAGFRCASFADDGNFSGSELANPARGDGAAVSFLGLYRWQLLAIHVCYIYCTKPKSSQLSLKIYFPYDSSAM